MSSRIRICISVCCWGVLTCGGRANGDEVNFNRDIRPILAKNCFACHGPDDAARKAELRLDTAAGAAKDLEGSRAIVPGKPDASQLIQRVESNDPEVVMPPPDSGHSLSDDEKRLLREWIAGGGVYDVHWAFVVPKKSPLPETNGSKWPRNAVDHFVLGRLQAAGRSPSDQADRFRLIRRVSLDLTGLPPTPEEADAFVGDTDANAFEKVVDRLLQSEAFGEHWARMWLDLARYADTKGYEKDKHRDIWRYRDWVIDALNQDMPFDRFTIAQLAGDLVPDPTADQILATAFHRNTMTNDEGGTDDEEFRVAAVKDRVDTTMQVWMGLTMGCAKCHSHKYDPITQTDYYSFFAFFNQTQDADRGDDAPVAPTPSKAQQQQLAQLQDRVKSLQQQLKDEPAGFADAFETWRAQVGAPWKPLSMAAFSSNAAVRLNQREDGTLIATGDRPDKDVWTLTVDATAEKPLTSIRLDVLPKSMAESDWPDANVALRELTVTLIAPDREPVPLKLINPRADFSQNGWEVAKAVNGNASVGWAVSPKISEPHTAVFDFEKPVSVPAGGQLKITFDLQYGGSLLLARFRVSGSSLPPRLLLPNVDIQHGLREAFARHEFAATKTLHEQLAADQKSLASVQAAIPKTPVMRELAADKQRETRIHERGNFLSPGAAVTASVPELLGRFATDTPANRFGVAQWLVQPENPLTARVMVNRVWARLFGVGIVETEEDFGTQGMLPTHPELLDWLAIDFREHGWSLKKLLRTIVLSATYRQSAVVTAETLAADPRNQLLGRGPRFRLPAETVRDQALAVSGLLTTKVGGPSVMPPQPAGVWKSTYNAVKWQDATGPDRFRRALYTYWKRTSPHPAMLTFDAGSGEVCQIRRVRTNTPLQALVTLNDTVFIEAAGALAVRMDETQGDAADRIKAGFRRVLIRPPSDHETARLVELYKSIRSEYAEQPQAANDLLQAAGLNKGDAALLAVANVLLNLDETLMKP